MADTDWITEGTKVAVYSTGNFGESVRFDTVARLTKTQIVLTAVTSTRFRRDDLTAVGDFGGYQTEFTVLLRPDDERVLALRARAVLRKLVAKVDELARAEKGGPVEVLDTLDLIKQAVSEAVTAAARLVRG
jgi:hypothetical protein